MKVLITGKEGQVARCLADRAVEHPELELVFAARSGTSVRLDLTDHTSISEAINLVNPDVIINAAAYTAVDQAEDEAELAMAINGIAPGVIALEAEKCGARLIHISTDYVYDGTLNRAYVESDPVNPLGVYGRTKLAGEEAVRKATDNYLIVRTAWVYSPYGKNFKKTMLELAKTRDMLNVVDDQIGTPTSAYEIADGLLAVCEKWCAGSNAGLGETFHLAGRDEMTWCGFARRIFAESKASGGPNATVHAITTADFPTKTKRPENSRLNSSFFARIF